MKVAVSIVRWYPWGGLQKDCGAVLEELLARGHAVSLLTLSRDGPVPTGVAVQELPAAGLTNHRRIHHFAKAVRQWRRGNVQDVHLGFNKIPGLDLYFAGDSCFAHKVRSQRPGWYRWLPRYRQLEVLERAVFEPSASARLLMISTAEMAHFVAFYGTQEERMVLVPPGLGREWLVPPDRARLRREVLADQGLGNGVALLLFVGSGFVKKGLGRAVQLLAQLRAAGRDGHLLVVGKDRRERFARIAQGLGVAGQTHFLGGRSDVARLMGAADVLLHPALDEAGGNVLLEALASGLPVLTTANCGLAGHVRDSGAGVVLEPPWDQAAAGLALEQLLDAGPGVLAGRGLEYIAAHDVTGRAGVVADELEQWVASRGTSSGTSFRVSR